jgi:hypothetical protein
MIKQLLLTLSLLGLLTGCISPTPSGSTINIPEGGRTFNYDCDGTTVNVSGASNTINLRGQCSTLLISGSTNVITVDMVTVINISGSNNHVMWKAATSGTQPVINNTGVNNVIEQVSGL